MARPAAPAGLLLLLLALAPSTAVALRRRAEQEPDEIEPTSEEAEPLPKDPKDWSVSQAQEELASNFTNSEVFQTKLRRWCKRDPDQDLCRMKNTFTHYCPTLYRSVPHLVNMSDFVASGLELLRQPASEIWSRQEAANTRQIKELLHLSLLQGASHPHKHKKSDAKEEAVRPKEEPAKPKESPVALQEKPAEKKQEPAVVAAIPAKPADPFEVLKDPFPELTRSAEYEERVQEHCSRRGKKHMDECLKQARDHLLCMAAGPAVLQHADFLAVTAKMQELMKSAPELQFRL
mmetsp:Transcript_98969/g.308410  ORF Transcript_98969/g.308410 Transcript_98969/m.308410 type:complete len:291 (-) Transcript_98969:177-1049(-)